MGFLIFKNFANQALNFLNSCLFPASCVNCGKADVIFCNECLRMAKQAQQICFVCKNFSESGYTHKQCLNPKAPKQLLCAYEYQSISKLIKAFKYDQIIEAGQICAHLLGNFIAMKGLNLNEYTITFVPMHKRKQNLKLFNHAQMLAEQLASTNQAKIEQLLTKQINTKPQANLKKEQRILNLKEVFKCALRTPGKIILIDDVFTTGSTLNECCSELFAAGAEEIICITLARD